MSRVRIDEVYNAVWKKQCDMLTANGCPQYVPKIAIYMDYAYWQACMTEIRGAVTPVASEFHQLNTVLGYPVWRVPHTHSREGDRTHVPFSVINADG